jgi:hypothetical protein
MSIFNKSHTQCDCALYFYYDVNQTKAARKYANTQRKKCGRF